MSERQAISIDTMASFWGSLKALYGDQFIRSFGSAGGDACQLWLSLFNDAGLSIENLNTGLLVLGKRGETRERHWIPNYDEVKDACLACPDAPLPDQAFRQVMGSFATTKTRSFSHPAIALAAKKVSEWELKSSPHAEKLFRTAYKEAQADICLGRATPEVPGIDAPKETPIVNHAVGQAALDDIKKTLTSPA